MRRRQEALLLSLEALQRGGVQLAQGTAAQPVSIARAADVPTMGPTATGAASPSEEFQANQLYCDQDTGVAI